MIKSKSYYIIHTPKCGGTLLNTIWGYEQVHLLHDGLFSLGDIDKQVYVLTRDPKNWYQSVFQDCLNRKIPWLEEFGLKYESSESNFKSFLEIATVNPPKPKLLNSKYISVPFDCFWHMKERQCGFWSFWHEFLSSADPKNIQISDKVKFIESGNPVFFPIRKANSSPLLNINWTTEMLSFLEIDNRVVNCVQERVQKYSLSTIEKSVSFVKLNIFNMPYIR